MTERSRDIESRAIEGCIDLLRKKRQAADVKCAKSSLQCDLRGEIEHLIDIAVSEAWASAVDLLIEHQQKECG